MPIFRWLTAAAIVAVPAVPAAALAPIPKGVGAPAAAEARVVGVYEGTVPAAPPPGDGPNPTGEVTVAVGPLAKPIVLVLTSYDPVVWNVEAADGAVARVIASGYHRQAVRGLGDRVPVTLLSHEGGDDGYFNAYRREAPAAAPAHERDEAKAGWDRLVRRVKDMTGLAVGDFQGEYTGRRFELR